MEPEELAWKEYQRLEMQFLEVCEYTHLAHEHLGVYSYELMNLLVAVGVEFDSVGNSLLIKWVSNGLIQNQTLHNELKAKQDRGDFFNMGDYRKAFEHRPFIASSRCVKVNRINLPIRPFTPPPESERTLKWWTAFTSLKHDRIANFIKSANMENVLSALGALLLTNLFFRSNGADVEFPGLDPSRLFSIEFLSVSSRTMGVDKSTYQISS
jgi:hypothetical protein